MRNKTLQSGYIALLSTIIISMILLGMMGGQALAGLYLRFMVLGIEAKEQADALARGCVDAAAAHVIKNSSYVGSHDEMFTMHGSSVGNCHIFPLQFNTPEPGQVFIRTQAVIRDSYATAETDIPRSQ